MTVTERFGLYAKYMVVAASFSLFMGNAPVGITFTLLFLFWLLSGNWTLKYQRIKNNPVVIAALVLWVMLLIGVTYSAAPLDFAIRKYLGYQSTLLFVAIVATTITDDLWRRRVVYAFIVGMTLTLMLTIVSWLFNFSWGVGPDHRTFMLFHDRITQNYFMSIMVFLYCAFFLLRASVWPFWKRLLVVGVVLVGILDIMFIVDGRSGQLTLLAMLFMVFILHYRRRGVWIGGAVLTVILLILIAVPSSFHERFKQAYDEYRQVIAGGEAVTSISERYDFYKYGIQMFLDRPVFGFGTGGPDVEYSKYDPAYVGENARPADLHSTYLRIATQLGVVGLAALFYLFISIIRYANYLDVEARYIALGYITAIMVYASVSSVLHSLNDGNQFALFIGALFYNLPELIARKRAEKAAAQV